MYKTTNTANGAGYDKQMVLMTSIIRLHKKEFEALWHTDDTVS